MNSLLCLTTLLAAVCLSSAASPEYESKVVSALKACAAEYKIDPKEVVEIMKANKLPETHEQKCVGGCFLMKMDYVTEMTVDWAKIKAANPLKYDTPELVAKANDVVDACAKGEPVKGSDVCELGLPVWKCLKEEAEKVQLPKPAIKLDE